MKKTSRKTSTKVTKATGSARSRSSATRSAATRSSATQSSAKPSAAKTRKAPAAKRETSRFNAAATAVRGRVASAIATIGAKMPWGESKADAIEILERDHRRFEDLLKQGEDTTERARVTRRELLATLTAELNAHELKEEKVLYPALKSHPEARDIVLEGYEEHHVADLIVEELHQVATDDEKWGAKFKVLKESLEHHIQEEEGEMFKTARGIFSPEELQDLGGRMLALGKASTQA
ncbi:MAG TPA: hemerythrin domain-containing protein [Vicinamibacterales bacterium]|nr:hemerythrin domain-containing protein [Vicinamibacterales bacterium]